MKTICWKGKRLKQLSVNKKRKSAGRNSSGTITSYHRGGGSKRLLRRIDSKRNVFLFNKSMKGIVRRIEYDPNRSSRIALIQWQTKSGSSMNCLTTGAAIAAPAAVTKTIHGHVMPSFLSSLSNYNSSPAKQDSLHDLKKHTPTAVTAVRNNFCKRLKKTTVISSSDVLNKNIDKKTKTQTQTQTLNNSKIETPYCYSPTKNKVDKKEKKDGVRTAFGAIFSYILACDQLQLGDTIMNQALTQGSYKLSSSFFCKREEQLEQPLQKHQRKHQKHPKKKSLTAAAIAAGNSPSSSSNCSNSSLEQLTQQSSLFFSKAKTETLNDTLNLNNSSLPSVKKTNSSCFVYNTPTAVWIKQSNTSTASKTPWRTWKQKATSVFFSKDAETEKNTGKKTEAFEASWQNTLPFQGIVIRKEAAENDNSYCFASMEQLEEEEKERLDAAEEEQKNVPMHDTFYQKAGNSIPLYNIAIGTFIYNIEINPGQGGKLVKAAGTFAQLVQQFQNTNQCLIRLPSGITKLLDSRCQATIGTVSNIGHAMRKLTKAGQNRWLGKRPVVRGVAMNPVDHPHGRRRRPY